MSAARIEALEGEAHHSAVQRGQTSLKGSWSISMCVDHALSKRSSDFVVRA